MLALFFQQYIYHPPPEKKKNKKRSSKLTQTQGRKEGSHLFCIAKETNKKRQVMLGVKANTKKKKLGGVTVAEAVINVSDKDNYDPELKKKN